jgi:O-antigen/teichoic acid export membrane protein
LLCLALALPFVTDLAVLGGAYRGILKMTPPVLADYVLLPTIRLAVIVILFAVGWRLWAVAVGTALGSFLASAFLSLRARHDFATAGKPAPWADAFRVLRYSGVIAGAVVVTTLTNSMDLLVLGRFATAQELGQYSLTKTLLLLMGVFGMAFTSGLGALVAERHTRGDREGVIRVLSLTARFVTLASLPIFAAFFFWGAEVLPLFGPTFAVSQAVVSLLAVSQFVVTVFAMAGWALSMTGKHVLELKILSVGLAVSAVLCLIAVPALGQLGAAIATCSAMAVANLVRVLFVSRSLRAFPFGTDIAVIAATGIVLAWLTHASTVHLLHSPLWNAVIGIAAFGLLYGGAAWVYLLSASERAGIGNAVGATARRLLGTA